MCNRVTWINSEDMLVALRWSRAWSWEWLKSRTIRTIPVQLFNSSIQYIKWHNTHRHKRNANKYSESNESKQFWGETFHSLLPEKGRVLEHSEDPRIYSGIQHQHGPEPKDQLMKADHHACHDVKDLHEGISSEAIAASAQTLPDLPQSRQDSPKRVSRCFASIWLDHIATNS